MNRSLLIPGLLSILAIATLNGCDGSGGSASEIVPLFAGTVSTPKRLAMPEVFLKNPAGERFSAEIDESGRFQLPEAMTDDRYLMRADLGNGEYLYSIAHLSAAQANRQNVHSYTDLVARSWFADQGLNINSVFDSNAGIDNFPSETLTDTIDDQIQSIISDVASVYGLADISLSTADYDATDTGIDRFLDENPVIIQNSRATIIVNDPLTNLQSIAVNRVPLQTTFSEVDVTPPEQPQDLRALGAGLNEIVLAWSIASDNIGVASYEILRDGVLVGRTPYPVYLDVGLSADTEYTYTVITRDESGNTSEPSIAAIGNVLDALDVVPPEIPSQATLNANTQSIDVFWSHSDLLDLARFEVTRTGGATILTREVTSSRFNDIKVDSGTEYCYTIVAVDASDNRSEPNPRACITTSGNLIADPTDSSITLATIEVAQTSISSNENTTITAFVNRLGDTTGQVSVNYTVTPVTASVGDDFIATGGTIVWADGDQVAKTIEVQLLADNLVEENETFTIVLTDSSSEAIITEAITTVTIIDTTQP